MKKFLTIHLTSVVDHIWSTTPLTSLIVKITIISRLCLRSDMKRWIRKGFGKSKTLFNKPLVII